MGKGISIMLWMVILLLNITSCSGGSQIKAIEMLQQTRAEDYFTNQTEIDFCHAIEWSDTNKMRIFLGDGLDVNTKGNVDDMNFLMWSFIKQNKDSYQYLLEHGANPNLLTKPSQRKYPISVMNLAVMPKDSFWLKEALEHRGNPNTSKGHESIIFEAIDYERNENVKLLLEAGADINYQNEISKDTPLINAMSGSRYDIAFFLLENGANPNLKKEDVTFIITNNRVFSFSGDYDKQAEYKEKVKKVLESKGFNFEQTNKMN